MISKKGKWKAIMVIGSVLQLVGLYLLSTIHYDTNFVLVSVYMFLLGAGLGMVMQNLVLIVQNAVTPAEIGVASSGIAFFRSLGGTIGVSVLGALMATKVADLMASKSAELGAAIAALGEKGKGIGAALASGNIPSVHTLPDSVRIIIESSYGDAVAYVFMVATPLSLLTILAIAFMPNLALSNQTRKQREESDAAAEAQQVVESAEQNLVEVSEASIAATPRTHGDLDPVRH
jgi:hypothetical protein